jgi:YidC/Oxa1 family membrane protein insertase
MSEQRRIFVAVALCLLIAFAWNWLLTRNRPKPTKPAPVAAQTQAPAEKLEAPPAAEPGTIAPSAPAPEVGPETRLGFETALYTGELSSSGYLAAFTLKNYKDCDRSRCRAPPGHARRRLSSRWQARDARIR